VVLERFPPLVLLLPIVAFDLRFEPCAEPLVVAELWPAMDRDIDRAGPKVVVVVVVDLVSLESPPL